MARPHPGDRPARRGHQRLFVIRDGAAMMGPHLADVRLCVVPRNQVTGWISAELYRICTA